ncbi:MAG: inositol monophosphatase [Candidatus Pacebacteria bacterium]|nr:inositol monophosphatase [Candidatus Paceibacterota bacterium]
MNLKLVQRFTIDLAEKAGKILLDNLDKIEIVKFKDRQDIATNIDYKVENLIINKIKKNFPGHTINTEEKGIIRGKSDYTWIIDPLDGSKHYIRRLPLFNVSIALQHKNEIIFGLVYNPMTKEMFYAAKNKGAYLNGKRIKVSSKSNLKDSFIFAELPSCGMSRNKFNKNSKILTKLNLNSYRVRALGCGPLGLSYVASGAFEAYIALGIPPKIGDIAAGLLILKEAGGKYTDLKGNPLQLREANDCLILASNIKAHKAILRLLK